MSKWATVQPWVSLLLRLVLGGVLLVAGALKLPDPGASARAVRAYQLVPEGLVPVFAYGLPALEVLIGIALIVGLMVRWSALVGGLFMVMFMFGISWAWAKGLTIDCGCFGGGGTVAANQTKYAEELIRDGLLLAAAAFLVVWPRARFSVDTWLFGPPAQRTQHEAIEEEPVTPL